MRMQSQSPTTQSMPPRLLSQTNTVLVVSANPALREQVAQQLRSLRWVVQQAESGAAAWLCQEEQPCAAVLLDEWLPDLASREFAEQFLHAFPTVEMLSLHGSAFPQAVRSPRRNELLLALRTVEEEGFFPMSQEAAASPVTSPMRAGSVAPTVLPPAPDAVVAAEEGQAVLEVSAAKDTQGGVRSGAWNGVRSSVAPAYVLPDLLGASAGMQELAELVRMAAPHSVSVLIEGETGVGKELVARAVHRLSTRAARPFITLNCAAIPEQLLEAELFGHTRGAFTGAVTSRTGRIEAAHGGTLFLDEIGEMPLALQAKMLRFLEYGEIQRIGENELLKVDVRIVAATHQPLEQHAEEGKFRLDLYHRLAAFPVWVPPLRDRMEDLPMLVTATLQRLGQTMPQRTMHAAALEELLAHTWPGNVRELIHVLQRAVILSTHADEIRPEHILLRHGRRGRDRVVH